MTIYPFMSWLLGVLCIETLTVMIVWHRVTRGRWRELAAGRALMILLAVVTLTMATAVWFRFDGPFNYYAGLAVIASYMIGILAVFGLGLTIIREQRRHNVLLYGRKKGQDE